MTSQVEDPLEEFQDCRAPLLVLASSHSVFNPENSSAVGFVMFTLIIERLRVCK